MSLQENATVLSVSDLNRRARQLLEIHLAQVWVRGEISNLSMPSSGHWYFTLKDDKAQIRCAMFRGNNLLLRFRPENGMQVIVRGRISLYEGRGEYQLIAEHLSADGAGALQIAFEQLKQKLADEGLFDDVFKQALPVMPRHIGVITSPTGAAIRDILSVLKRRFPAIAISVFPVAVQGNGAAAAIARAIMLANTREDIDALIVGRGGGSIEDLWAFNEEVVARAIFSSEIPIVSAVGHETDFTIADFVADVRAPTPSAAAEMLSPDQSEIAARIDTLREKMQHHLQYQITGKRQQLLHLMKRLRHPAHQLREQSQRLDHLEWRLHQALQQKLLRQRHRQEQLATRLQRQHPQQALQVLAWRLQQASRQLRYSANQLIKPRQQRLQHLVAMLDSVSPLNTLKRGYAIASNARYRAITSSTQLQQDEALTLQLADGQVACRVTGLVNSEDQ